MSKSVYAKDYREIINRLKQVADKLGKPQSYVSKIELKERRLDVAEVKKFAEIYKKNISYFIK